MSSSLVLVGPMGAGKSTIGKALSQKLKLPLIDIDQLIVDKAGADIPWIFDVEGEAGFRSRESQALLESLSKSSPAAVVATGGGIVKLEENRKLLMSAKAVVYLQASVEQQVERTSKDKNRPLLQEPDPEAVLQKLMAERGPWYEQVADFSVQTDKYSPKQLVDQIVKYWQSLA
jgi:shikimate kinase